MTIYSEFDLETLMDAEELVGTLQLEPKELPFSEEEIEQEQKELLKNALNEAVIYKAADDKFLGLIINNYCGLSCYIPGCADEITEEYYSQLKWYNRIYK